MKKVLRIVWIAVLLFVVLVGLKLFLEDRFSLRNVGLQGELHLKHVDILLVGSSHTRQGYDMHLLEAKTGLTAYAIAYDGLDFYHMLPLLEAVLRDPAQRPRLCIIEAYTANLARPPEFDDPRLFFDAPFRMKMKLLASYAKTHPGPHGWEDLFVLVVNRGTDQIISYPLTRRMIDPYFYRGGYVRKTIPGVPRSEFSSYRIPMAGSQPNSLQLEALQKILALLVKDRVPMVLVDPPMPASVARQPEVVHLKNWFRQMAAEHSVMYNDGDEEFPIDDPAMFGDSNHLSTRGRELYTNQLMVRLMSTRILPRDTH